MTDTPPTPETQAFRLKAVQAQLTNLLNDPAVRARLRQSAGEGDWSAMETLGHTVEMIPYWMHHCGTIIRAGEPPNFGRTLESPERLEAVARAALADPDEMARLLADAVRDAARRIRAMTVGERGKTGNHNRRGPMTVADVIQILIVEHAEDHLAQVRAAVGR